MTQRQGSLYLFTGLILGFALGLLYTWVISPMPPQNAAPKGLGAAQKDQYRILIATAYRDTGDLVRARARLDLLGESDPQQGLLEQAERQQYMVDAFQVESLRLLADALANSINLDETSP